MGSGRMGVVYKAEDTTLGRYVALKFLPVDIPFERMEISRLTDSGKASLAAIPRDGKQLAVVRGSSTSDVVLIKGLKAR